MSKKDFVRKRLMVDRSVQGALVVRVVLYWMVCLFDVAVILLCWRMITGAAQPMSSPFDGIWSQIGPAVVASLLLLPMVIIDVLRLSNRFAGPLFRLRRAMRDLARGEDVEPISFRDGDFWQEVAQEFNAVVARCQHPGGKWSEGSADDAGEEDLTGAAAGSH